MSPTWKSLGGIRVARKASKLRRDVGLGLTLLHNAWIAASNRDPASKEVTKMRQLPRQELDTN